VRRPPAPRRSVLAVQPELDDPQPLYQREEIGKPDSRSCPVKLEKLPRQATGKITARGLVEPRKRSSPNHCQIAIGPAKPARKTGSE